MAIGLQVWSKTPVSNATADSNINFAEGMAPSQVNDSCRAVMGSAASWRDDNNGTLVTSGTTTAATLITNQVEAALTTGYTVTVQWGFTPDVNCTLAVDGLAAQAIQAVYGTNIAYGQLQTGQVNSLVYTTGTGASAAWILKDYQYPILSTGGTTSGSIIAGNPWTPLFGASANTLASSVNLTTASFTDGPSVAVSSAGTYYACGNIMLNAPTANFRQVARLWDGTTVISEGGNVIGVGGIGQTLSLCGIIANPVGNLRISAATGFAGQTAGIMAVAQTTTLSTGKAASYLTVIRIA